MVTDLASIQVPRNLELNMVSMEGTLANVSYFKSEGSKMQW